MVICRHQPLCVLAWQVCHQSIAKRLDFSAVLIWPFIGESNALWLNNVKAYTDITL